MPADASFGACSHQPMFAEEGLSFSFRCQVCSSSSLAVFKFSPCSFLFRFVCLPWSEPQRYALSSDKPSIINVKCRQSMTYDAQSSGPMPYSSFINSVTALSPE